MFKLHWVSLSAAALLLAACATAPQESVETVGSVTTSVSDSNINSSSTTNSGLGSIQNDNANGGVAYGSIDDFMLNVPDRVFFGFDRYDLSAEATAALNLQVEWLKRYPWVDIVIGGHADNRGTREYNLALSERRAQSVRDYMVGLGISADRVGVVPYGKERPAVLGNNEEAWAANRRAETKIEAS